MAVTITKPEINVREKLKELDFETVPFQKMPSGSVIQVAQSVDTSGEFETTSTSYTATNLSASITPSSSSSKVLINYSVNVDEAGGNPHTTVYRDGTNVAPNSDYDGFTYIDSVTDARILMQQTGIFLDSPLSTSEVTYTIRIKSRNGSTVRYRPDAIAGIITLMEIAG